MFKKSKLIKISALLLTMAFMLALTACGGATSESNTQTQTTASAETKAASSQGEASTNAAEAAVTESNSTKTLVVFFSATGTTKGVAEQIASVTNADTYEILAAQPYTTDDLNWNDSESRTTKEQNDNPFVRKSAATSCRSTDIRPFLSVIRFGGARIRALWTPLLKAMISAERR